jgi:glycosyltransferase involved in cell wall biosynthesis
MRLRDRLAHRWQRLRNMISPPTMLEVCQAVPDPSRRNVLIFSEALNATYYLYFHFPLMRLHEAGQVNVAALSQEAVRRHFNDANLETRLEAMLAGFEPHLVVFSRYVQPWGPRLQAYFQARGIPTVYHLDDDLFDLPDSLGQALVKRHTADAVVAGRAAMIERADVALASTEVLAEQLGSHFPGRSFGVGPAVPFLGDRRRPAARASGLVIGYMGSQGHRDDLAMVVPALTALMAARPELRFETFGTIAMPEALKQFGPRVKAHPPMRDYNSFLEHLGALGWDVGLAPLVNMSFNRCKTPVKFVEYASCGIPVAASDISVYRGVIDGANGVLVPDDQWLAILDGLLDNRPARTAMAVEALRTCRDRFPLGALVDQWMGWLSSTRP